MEKRDTVGSNLSPSHALYPKSYRVMVGEDEVQIMPPINFVDEGAKVLPHGMVYLTKKISTHTTNYINIASLNFNKYYNLLYTYIKENKTTQNFK